MYPYHHIYTTCRQLMNRHVDITIHDGGKIQGTIVDVDSNHVTLLVPNQNREERYYGYPYPYPYPPYPPVYPPYPPNPWGRLVLPLTAIAALGLLF